MKNPEIPIYPEYSSQGDLFQTYVRIKQDDIWYLLLVKTSGGPLEYFLRQVYLCILFTKIDTSLKSINGVDIFLVDDNQQSEEKRLFPDFTY